MKKKLVLFIVLFLAILQGFALETESIAGQFVLNSSAVGPTVSFDRVSESNDGNLGAHESRNSISHDWKGQYVGNDTDQSDGVRPESGGFQVNGDFGHRDNGGINYLNQSLIDKAATASGVFTTIETVYNIIRFCIDHIHYMDFQCGPNGVETVVGEPYEFDLIAYNGNLSIDFPITIKMIGHSEEFEFCETTILPEEVKGANGSDFYKVMKIKFRPAHPGLHKVYFSIRGNDKIVEDLYLECNAVMKQQEKTIYVKPSSILHFQGPVNVEQTDSFIVSAIGLTKPLSVEVKANDYDYNLDSYLMYTVDKQIITPQQAACGETVKVKFKPTREGTCNAHVVITGEDGLSKKVLFYGNATNKKFKSSESLYFDTIQVGDDSTRTVKVTGPGPLRFEVWSAEGHGWSDAGMYSIVGQSEFNADECARGAEVFVKYHPTSSGTHLAKIDIIYNDSDIVGTIYLLGDASNSEICVDSSNLTINSIPFLAPTTQKFRVTGTDLSGYLTITLMDETGMFSVTPLIFNAAEAQNGKDVWVTYNPTEFGPHKAKIIISGGGASKNATVQLLGTTIFPEITVTPTSLEFEAIVLESTSKKTFTVTGSNLIDSLTVTSSNSNFTVSPTTITASQAASGKTVTVTYQPTSAGSHSGTITVSGGGAASKTVSVSGTTKPPTMTVSPTSLDFGNLIVGNTSSAKTITVTATYMPGTPSVTLSQDVAGIFKITSNTLGVEGGSLKVTFSPESARSYGGQITISGGGVTKTVSLSGKGVGSITVNPTSLEFGTIGVGSTSKKTFTVTGSNLTGSLTVTSSNSNFTVSPTTITASQAASGKTVTVTYQPTSAGSHSGTITVSGGGAASKTVSVSGTAKSPTMTVSPTSLDFGNVIVGNTSSAKTITVTASYMPGTPSVTLSQDVAGIFKITSNTLGVEGGSLKVTFSPESARSYGGQITISGGGVTKTVTLSGTSKSVINTSTNSLNFSAPGVQQLTVWCKGANSALTLTLGGSDSKYFALSKTSISATDANNGSTVAVTCKPSVTSVDRASASIVISGGGASSSKTVNLSYVKGQGVQITAVEPNQSDDEANGVIEVGSDEIQLDGWGGATGVDEVKADVKIYADGLDIVIESPVAQSAIISDIVGRARIVNLEAGHNVIPANASGIHIVKVGEKTAKLMLR